MLLAADQRLFQSMPTGIDWKVATSRTDIGPWIAIRLGISNVSNSSDSCVLEAKLLNRRLVGTLTESTSWLLIQTLKPSS